MSDYELARFAFTLATLLGALVSLSGAYFGWRPGFAVASALVVLFQLQRLFE